MLKNHNISMYYTSECFCAAPESCRVSDAICLLAQSTQKIPWLQRHGFLNVHAPASSLQCPSSILSMIELLVSLDTRVFP